MKVTYDGTVLGDDSAGDYILVPGRSHEREVQADPLAFATSPFTKGRGNRRNGVEMVVTKQHATIAAAALFVCTHPDGLGDDGILLVEEGATSKSIADAALTACSLVELVGRSTVFRYSFTGGAFA